MAISSTRILNQWDERINTGLIIPHRNGNTNQLLRTGCLAMVYITMFQLKTRYVFDPEELRDVVNLAYQRGAIGKLCAVTDPNKFFNVLGNWLGITGGSECDWSGPFGREKYSRKAWNHSWADFTVLCYKTSAQDGTHFMLGNSDGDRIYDPDYGRSYSYVKGFGHWRAWKVSYPSLSNDMIKKIKRSKGYSFSSNSFIDYVPYGKGGRSGERIVYNNHPEDNASRNPFFSDDPPSLVLHDGYVEVIGDCDGIDSIELV